MTYTNGATAEHAIQARPMLPHNPDAERCALGSILIDPDAYYELAVFLTPEHFHDGRHAAIYKAIADLYAHKRPVDVVTLSEVLKSRKVMNDPEGYLVELLQAVPTSINAKSYAKIVEAAAIRRNMIRTGGAIAKLAWDESVGIERLIEESENSLRSVFNRFSTSGIVNLRDGVGAAYDAIAERREQGGQMIGLPTGFIDLDRLQRGLKPGRFYLLAGRPGMGKSALSNAIALNAAARGKHVLIFNLEMSTEEIVQRFIATVSKTALDKVEEGRLSDGEFAVVQRTIGDLSRFPIFIDDTAGMSPVQMGAKARRLHAERGLDLIILDYIQLMGAERDYYNENALLTYISRQCKILAKDLNIPLLALSQLNRSLESRQDKRPQLADLRGSGSLEQDADCVMFIYRDEYYKPDTTERPGIAEIDVAKHRSGKTGVLDLYWNGAQVRFENLSRAEAQI